MSSEDGLHITISRLWRHSQELYADVLSTTEWHHLMRCERCCDILRVCYKSQSADDAKDGLKKLGIDANLEDPQATA
jgi:hypothetical protein